MRRKTSQTLEHYLKEVTARTAVPSLQFESRDRIFVASRSYEAVLLAAISVLQTKAPVHFSASVLRENSGLCKLIIPFLFALCSGLPLWVPMLGFTPFTPTCMWHRRPTTHLLSIEMEMAGGQSVDGFVGPPPFSSNGSSECQATPTDTTDRPTATS